MTEERPDDKGHLAEYTHRVHDRSKRLIDETVLGKWLEDRGERRWLVGPRHGIQFCEGRCVAGFHGSFHTKAPPRARSAGRLYCTVFLVCFCSQGENTVFFVFLNPIFVVLPPREMTEGFHLVEATRTCDGANVMYM